MEPCSNCGRTFNLDALERHEPICKKSKNVKRKVFDSTQQRIKGTDMEQFVRKAKKSPSKNNTTNLGRQKTLSWRQKHEDFIQTVRTAREINVVAKSGEPLPPHVPSGPNPDYVQCSYCQRYFEPSTAERHVPFCKQQASKINKTPGQIDQKATDSLKKRTQYKPPSLKKKTTPSSSSERVTSGGGVANKPPGSSVVRQNSNFGSTYTFTKPLYTSKLSSNDSHEYPSKPTTINNSTNKQPRLKHSVQGERRGEGKESFSSVRSTAFSRIVDPPLNNNSNKSSPFSSSLESSQRSSPLSSLHTAVDTNIRTQQGGTSSASRRLFAALEYSDQSSDEGTTTTNSYNREGRERGGERGGDRVSGLRRGDMARPSGASRFGRGADTNKTATTHFNDTFGQLSLQDKSSYTNSSRESVSRHELSSYQTTAVFKEPINDKNGTYPTRTSIGGLVMANDHNPYTTTTNTNSTLPTNGRRNSVPLNEYGLPMSKFCYECGSKFPVPQAKYCCECGTKRI